MDRPKSAAGLCLITLFLLAQVPFSFAEWVSVGTAPNDAGVYSAIIQATYNGVTGTFPLEFTVGDVDYSSSGLTIEPIYPLDRTTPIELKYDIKLNGSADFAMMSNNLTIYFSSGTSVISSFEGALTLENDTYWHATVNVPFKGEYKAVITLLLQRDNAFYGGSFLTYFKSNTVSEDLVIRESTDKQILTPSESFKAILSVDFDDQPLPSAELFKANLYGSVKKLMWDGHDEVYSASMTAPNEEGIYLMSFYADGQDIIRQKKVYVVDTSKAKSSRCPLANNVAGGCTEMSDVRKCVADVKSELIVIPESSIVQCFESAAGGILQGSIICSSDKGDLDGDSQLDMDDLSVLQDMILPLSQTSREEYAKCADYDLDGDVDEQDLKCLTNVISGKWDGDFMGGICFDLNYESPLKGDLTGDNFVKEDDMKLMGKLVTASSSGIDMTPRILYAADFNQDRKITSDDATCIRYFVGMDLDKPETMLGAGQTIPAGCMKIYDLDNCQGIGGDLNGDILISQVDEILIMLIEKKQVTGYGMKCADVNKDSRITIEDVECVNAYLENDRDAFFTCIGCEDNIPTEYLSIAEICNDGVDNDCDGLVDRTSTSGLDDQCGCTEDTPCWMVQDADAGVTAGIKDGKVKVCRKLEGDTSASDEATGAALTYRWYAPTELTCEQGKECKSLLCADTVFKCAYGGNGWNWYDTDGSCSGGGLPIETDMPDASPKFCGDKHDNDCNCGDQVCAEEEAGGSMFTSGEFWIGAVAGAVVGFFTAGTAIPIILGLGSTLGGFFIDDPALQAGLMGFGLGMAVGQYGGIKAGAGSTTPKFGAGSWHTDPATMTSNIGGQSITTTQPGTGGFWSGIAQAGSVEGTTPAIIGMAAAAIGVMATNSDYKEALATWKHTESCST